MSSKKLTLIFKPITACNLRCKYCYAENPNSTEPVRFMSIEEMKKVFDWIADYCLINQYKKISIIWHGGEPLLIPVDVMETILQYGESIFSAKGLKHKYLIQSNLVNISDERVELIKRYFNNKIGGSLDVGTSTRIFPNGENSKELVIKNIKSLKDAGVNVSVITMLTPENIDHIKEIYNSFKEIGINFKSAAVFPTAFDKNVDVFSLTDKEYIKASIELFDLWFNDRDCNISITNYLNMATYLITNKAHSCSLSPSCQPDFLSIGCDGSLYPCGRFSGEKYSLGNIFSQSPEEFTKQSPQLKLNADYPTPLACKKCKYYSICHGPCLYERMVMPKPELCRTKALYSHIEMRLQEAGVNIKLSS